MKCKEIAKQLDDEYSGTNDFVNFCVIMWSLSYFDLVKFYLYCLVKDRRKLECFCTFKFRYYMMWKMKWSILRLLCQKFEDAICGIDRTRH